MKIFYLLTLINFEAAAFMLIHCDIVFVFNLLYNKE